MKKYFLILLFSLFTILTAAGQTVTISDQVARYFLEQDLRAKALDSLLIIKQQRIDILGEQLVLKEKIEQTYINDAKTYKEIIETKDDQLKQKDDLLVNAGKEIKRQQRQKNMLLGAGVGAGIGSLIGQPLIGAGIGAGAGFIVNLFKRNKYESSK
jgi:hypothetical protein